MNLNAQANATKYWEIKMSANERQVGGDHYRRKGTIQHWDFAAARNYDYFQGQITKYVDRWKEKNGIEDLEKGLHFLEKYIETEKLKLREANKAAEDIAKRKPLVERMEIPPKIHHLTEQPRPFGYVHEDD